MQVTLIYARENEPQARERKRTLDLAPDVTVFIDVISLRAGQDWKKTIEAAITASSRVILLWSHHAAGSKEVEHEWRLCLSLQASKGESFLIVDKLDETPLPDELSKFHFTSSSPSKVRLTLETDDFDRLRHGLSTVLSIPPNRIDPKPAKGAANAPQQVVEVTLPQREAELLEKMAEEPSSLQIAGKVSAVQIAPASDLIRVFVSSLTRELTPYRQAACEEIKKLGPQWDVLSQDWMGWTTNRTTLQTSLAAVARADLFVLIIAWSELHAVDPETVRDQLTIIRHEIQCVQEKSRAFVAFVTDDSLPKTATVEDVYKNILRLRETLVGSDTIPFQLELPEFREKIRSLIEAFHAQKLIDAGLGTDVTRLRRALAKSPAPWSLGEHLGSGDFSDVYKVTSKDKSAALKLYRRRENLRDDTRGRTQFRRQIETLQRLVPHARKHRSIVELIEGPVSHEACVWCVIEYVQGKRVSAYLIDRTPSLDQQLRICRDIVNAIQAAHEGDENGPIYHRDLSPDNVLVDETGRAVVVDFGLLPAYDDLSTDPLSKLAFRPPEERSPLSLKDTSGPARDIWSLGMMMHFVLTGEVAWSRDERIAQRRRSAFEPADEKLLMLGTAIEWILMEQPKDRPQVAQDIAGVLEAIESRDFEGALKKIDAPDTSTLWDDLDSAALRWRFGGGSLWSGQRLHGARRLIDEQARVPGLVARFVKAGESRERWKTAAWVGAMVLTALIGILAMAWAYKVREVADREEAERRRLADHDIGRFGLILAPFDWDAEQRHAIPVTDPAKLPELDWKLRELDEAGTLVDKRLDPEAAKKLDFDPGQRPYVIEARGGAAILEIDGRGPANKYCGPSVLTIALPGFRDRRPGSAKVLTIWVPTCEATLAGAEKIPAGKFIFGGRGEPPIPEKVSDGSGGDITPDPAPEQQRFLAEFYMQATETTNAAFAVFARMSAWTGIPAPTYVVSEHLKHAHEPNYPVTNIDYPTALKFCRYWGLTLPTTSQWEKAARGGLEQNDHPRRSFPWAPTERGKLANLKLGDDYVGVAPVKSFPKDESPFKIFDLAGNAQEWTLSPDPVDPRQQAIRGSSWLELANTWQHAISFSNVRAPGFKTYAVGFRCATSEEP